MWEFERERKSEWESIHICWREYYLSVFKREWKRVSVIEGECIYVRETKWKRASECLCICVCGCYCVGRCVCVCEKMHWWKLWNTSAELNYRILMKFWISGEQIRNQERNHLIVWLWEISFSFFSRNLINGKMQVRSLSKGLKVTVPWYTPIVKSFDIWPRGWACDTVPYISFLVILITNYNFIIQIIK